MTEFIKNAPTFVDLCAGCGGLSLGLVNAGWRGLFAVEKDGDAFGTLAHNLLEGQHNHFQWPPWLPRTPHSLEEMTTKYAEQLKAQRGKVDLLAGGPPCQGFSTIGRRKAHDPRNQLFRQYLKVVELLQPKVVLMENVRGIMRPFKGDDAPRDSHGNPLIYADIIKVSLGADYHVWSDIVQAKDFGVPQTRPRFILIGLRKRTPHEAKPSSDPFAILNRKRLSFLAAKGLGPAHTTVQEAISDLCKNERLLRECLDSPRFKQGAYGEQTSTYQRLMHGHLNGALADSHRFAKHREETEKAFKYYQNRCERGKKIAQSERGPYANKKHTIYILDPKQPAPTVTTLPDDIIHYSEPRILTVREMARLQSFPDTFQFKGKYTTGGDRRTKECPRYTQVGNAVPPLLAEALGTALRGVLGETPAHGHNAPHS